MIFKREGVEATAAGAAERDRSTLPARTRARRGGHDARTSPTRRKRPARFSSTRRRSSSSRISVVANGDGRVPRRARRRTGSSPPTRRTAGSSPTTATTIPRYAGNVVKAMASAKDGYPQDRRAVRATSSRRSIRRSRPSATATWRELVARLDDELIARVEDVVRLTPTIVEVIVKAPAAARQFQPGQFYRLQNYESVAPARRRARAAADGRHRADRRLGRQGDRGCCR